MSGHWRSWAAGAAAAVTLWAAAVPASAEPIRGAEWPLDARHFDADRVWTVSRGDGVTVAVVDTGVAASHPDLAGQVLPGTSLLGDGGDGRSDTSEDSHGTAISGIIAGTGGTDGQGMFGLAPGAKILPVKVASGEQMLPSVVAQAIVWATDHGARVINVSLSTTTPDPLLKQAVAYALRKDAVVVAAAGNHGTAGNPVQYPAAFPGVVSVSGVNEDDSFWTPSESGAGVAVAAPASDIYSTNDIGQYVHAEGTSYAAGYVSATAALIRSRWPELTQGQAVRRLIGATKDHRNRPDPKFGYGLLDPFAALSATIDTTDTGNPLDSPTAAPARASASRWPAWLGWTAAVLAVLSVAVAAIVTRRRRTTWAAAMPSHPPVTPKSVGNARGQSAPGQPPRNGKNTRNAAKTAEKAR
ncbi:type VII secretion-associated serine protease mycosin [Kitasatospora griseola]|uniref:type VII secretion-associated serine protease mycosin n=1 Tax=Kitasatospora griseola TaxID=2064 RepID=UPI003855D867